MPLSAEEGAHLVALARDALERFTRGDRARGEGGWEHGFLREPRGAFVTLKKNGGELRGCVGFAYPVKPLGDAVVEAAVQAAAYDPRFPSMKEGELEEVLVEVSALSPPQRIVYAKAKELPRLIQTGRDGLIISARGASGLLLPQVATELKLSPEEFLSDTCMKAGLMPDAWLTERIMIERFQAEVFCETAPRGTVRRAPP